MRIRAWICCAGLCLALTSAAPADDWPQWLGPERNGVSAEIGWSFDWPEGGPPVMWRRQVGAGYASVAVVGERVYTLGNAGGKDTAWCLDVASGEVLWSFEYACPGAGGGFPGPAATPTVHDGRVYTLSRVGHLHCLDAASGELLWAREPEGEFQASDRRRPDFWHGAACSPLLVGDLVILEVGAADGSVYALDARTGETRWRGGDEKLGYSSPTLATVDGAPCVVVFTGSAVLGLAPADGTVLWRYPWDSEYHSNIITPVAWDGRVYVSSSQDVGAALLAVDGAAVTPLWRNKEMYSHYSTPVERGGFLYGIDGGQNCPRENETSLLKCLDLRSGQSRWAYQGFGKGGLMLAGERLLVLSEAGQLAVVDATPEGFRQRASAQVLKGPCWTMPVLANGRIYCRNAAGELVCVDVRREGAERGN